MIKLFKHNKKGFTLVELLVVVVLLAILISVSIAGYGKYVGMGRKNMDFHNVDVVKQVFATNFALNEELMRLLEETGGETIEVKLTWTKDARTPDKMEVLGASGETEKLVAAITESITGYMGGELPEPHSVDSITLTFIGNKNGYVTITDDLVP